jgi:hypothetical protein
MSSLRAGNFRGVGRAVAMGVAINYDKLRGTYSDAKYNPGGSTPVIPAKPYQRPAETARTK